MTYHSIRNFDSTTSVFFLLLFSFSYNEHKYFFHKYIVLKHKLLQLYMNNSPFLLSHSVHISRTSTLTPPPPSYCRHYIGITCRCRNLKRNLHSRKTSGKDFQIFLLIDFLRKFSKFPSYFFCNLPFSEFFSMNLSFFSSFFSPEML